MFGFWLTLHYYTLFVEKNDMFYLNSCVNHTKMDTHCLKNIMCMSRFSLKFVSVFFQICRGFTSMTNMVIESFTKILIF